MNIDIVFVGYNLANHCEQIPQKKLKSFLSKNAKSFFDKGYNSFYVLKGKEKIEVPNHLFSFDLFHENNIYSLSKFVAMQTLKENIKLLPASARFYINNLIT